MKNENKTRISRLHFLQSTEKELREYLRLENKLSKEEIRLCARIKRMLVHTLPKKKKRKRGAEDE